MAVDSADSIDPAETDLLRPLREQSRTKGSVFWSSDDELAVLDPELAQQVNAANYVDLTLPDKLGDLLLGRKSPPVYWKQVRAAWSAQLRRLAEADGARQLAERMQALLDRRLDRRLDLVRLAQDLSVEALVPTVLAELPPGAMQRVLRAHELRIQGLLTSAAPERSWTKALRTSFILLGAGLALRAELRGRAAGRRQRRLDLTDAVVDLLPALGVGRAVAAVTGLLAAIAGPPGAAVACLLYELARQPEWAARVAAELSSVTPEDLYAQVDVAPGKVAPQTHRFVKETLRLWSPPLLLSREVRTEIRLGELCLKPGQRYLLSPHLIHHDANNWQDPETFDPDRWLPASRRGGCPVGGYVPFGFAPRACIGAGLGTTMLMLVCHLVSTRYRVDVPHAQEVRMSLGAAALPVDFHGTLTRRGG